MLVLIIWGGVFWKYFGHKGTPNEIMEYSDITVNKQNYNIIKDTFSLHLASRDPFEISQRVIRTGNKHQIENKPKPVTKPKPKENVVWPTITYHGFVKGENNDTRLILLKVENRLYRKREKETIKDITLIKAFNDSLVVSMNNINKTIKRQQ